MLEKLEMRENILTQAGEQWMVLQLNYIKARVTFFKLLKVLINAGNILWLWKLRLNNAKERWKEERILRNFNFYLSASL